jgi:hypothetical protein
MIAGDGTIVQGSKRIAARALVHPATVDQAEPSAS